MSEPVVFAQSFESLFRHGLKGKLDASALRDLRELRVDLEHLQPAYPVATWAAAMKVAAEAAFPQCSPNEARFELGRHMLVGLDATLVGKALLALARAIGPRRTLERMTRNNRTSNNYINTVLEERPDGTLRMVGTIVPEYLPRMEGQPWLEWALSSGFQAGLLTGVLDTLSVRGFSVEPESSELHPPRVSSLIRLPG
jgi:uncharacterized protein (TIGR02265 family)